MRVREVDRISRETTIARYDLDRDMQFYRFFTGKIGLIRDFLDLLEFSPNLLLVELNEGQGSLVNTARRSQMEYLSAISLGKPSEATKFKSTI